MTSPQKLRVAILFGGKSAEHEVSLQSAKNVIEALDRSRFEPVLIGIDKNGVWHLNEESNFLLNQKNPKLIALNRSGKEVVLTPGSREKSVIAADCGAAIGSIDVVFPVLHGPYGEDGAMQGLLKLAGIPFVGSGVLGSAVGMDKDVMKRLFRDAGLPIGKFLSFGLHQASSIDFSLAVEKLGLPLFVKPANLGSSVGISRVTTREEFSKAIQAAFEFDRKIVVEENLPGRELGCSVLGNETPIASLPGEVVSNNAQHGFYSYEAKYIDEHGAVLRIPADLPSSKVSEIQDLAIRAYQALCCEGMARADFFMTTDGALYVNELNTIPGFTSISMYPKLWEASGKSYTQLISELIDLAMKRFEEEKKLKTSV